MVHSYNLVQCQQLAGQMLIKVLDISLNILTDCSSFESLFGTFNCLGFQILIIEEKIENILVQTPGNFSKFRQSREHGGSG